MGYSTIKRVNYQESAFGARLKVMGNRGWVLAESSDWMLPARQRLRLQARRAGMLDYGEGHRRGALVHEDTRSYLKNADCVQGQEAHLNQYNQMCYPAYAGVRVDPPSLKKLWRDRRKSQRQVPKLN
jgi:hypothetical protein